MTIVKTPFGHGAYVFHMKAAGVQVRVTNFGAALVSLVHSDGTDTTLGFESVTGYQADTQFVGVIVGRYGNRIAQGSFKLDGHTWRLPCNDGHNHLHGGPEGFGRKLWTAEIDETRNIVTFTITSPHLDQGYPGTVTASASYCLTQSGTLRLILRARSNRPTIVNLVPHAYFNLAGRGDVLHHEVKIHATQFTPFDSDNIPTGAISPVAGTDFDYRDWKVLDGNVDQNFVIDGEPNTLRSAAQVRDPASGRHLLIEATAPGLQLYGGKNLGANQAFSAHRGLCLEPQYFPDSPNQANFATPCVLPGDTMQEMITYRFV